jgi:hypothetical protein
MVRWGISEFYLLQTLKGQDAKMLIVKNFNTSFIRRAVVSQTSTTFRLYSVLGGLDCFMSSFDDKRITG